MTVKIKKPSKRQIKIKGERLTTINMVEGVGTLKQLQDEIDEMWDVLLGHAPAPVDYGLHTLQEVATVYYARAKFIHGKIREAELDGDVPKGSRLYGFRTGMLRDFTEASSKFADLGSRRVTVAQLAAEMKLDYGDIEELEEDD